MAKFEQPNAFTTALLSGFLFVITLSGLQIWAPKLASTPQFTILGGFICSLLFVFSLICVGSFERETKWIEVLICLGVAMFAGATVHRVCVTTCFLFACAELAYMNIVARHVNKQPEIKKFK